MSALTKTYKDQQPQARCLVADIGGTHARFAIASPAINPLNNKELALNYQHTYKVAEFQTLTLALLDYLAKVPEALRPSNAVLAVASAVTDDQIVFTNSQWSFSISALKQQVKLDELLVINDFAAVAWALPSLNDSDLETVGTAHAFDAKKSGVYAVLGPGTGLGVAALKIENQHAIVLETEGGHIGFAPRTHDEIKILQFLSKQYERVSYERLLCGNGLLNLYRARSDLMKLPATLLTPEAVSAAATQNDPAASAAAEDFCSIFGAFAGDTTLMFGAWQGVYMSGGLLPHLMDEKGKKIFRQAFEDKGRFSSLLEKTPTWIIKRTDVGKLGAAYLWISKQKH